MVFNPEDAMVYATSQIAVSLTVAKAIPAVTWPAPDPIAHGDALSATQLNATSTIPGSFAFTPHVGEYLRRACMSSQLRSPQPTR